MKEETDSKNREALASLLEQFAPLEERLVPEVEPATVYLPHDDR